MPAAAESWPEHWLPPEVAFSGRVVLVGSLRYHQLTVSMEDAITRERLGALGYRLSRIEGDPQRPQRDQRGVYRRRVPDEDLE